MSNSQFRFLKVYLAQHIYHTRSATPLDDIAVLHQGRHIVFAS